MRVRIINERGELLAEYDPEKHYILVEISAADKRNIAEMPDEATIYAVTPGPARIGRDVLHEAMDRMKQWPTRSRGA